MSAVGRSQRGRGGRRSGGSSSGGRVGSTSQGPSVSIGSEPRSRDMMEQEETKFDFPEDLIGGQPFEDPMIDIDFIPEDPQVTANFETELDNLLREPGRAERLPIIDPNYSENSIWFGRDRGVLTRKISKILKAGFHGPYYSWGKVPVYKQQQFMLTFARSYHWDPLITEVVKTRFYDVCTKRMKGMVSQVKKNGKRPRWIPDTIWETMTGYWATSEAQAKSEVFSTNRLSERDGLGPHKHLSGQKSYLQVQEDMEDELGRPVSIGEVFIKTHTKSDGSYVDLKAKQIVETYEKNLEEKLSQIDPSEISDGNSRISQIPAAEMNELFIQSSIPDRRGNQYGLGSFAFEVKGSKRNHPGSSSTQAFHDVREELTETKRELQETKGVLADQQKLVADQQKLVADQANRISSLEMVLSYMRSTDENFTRFVEAQQQHRGNDDDATGSGSAPSGNL